MHFLSLPLSCALAAFLLCGCNAKEENHAQETIISPQPSITAVTPEYGNYTTQITATASVQPSLDGIVSITSPTAGTVDALRIAVGERVGRNAPLLIVRSSDISDLHNDRLSAEASYTQAKHLHDMNKELYKLGGLTANELAASQSNLQQAEALMKGVSQKLNYYGASSGQTLTLRSPIEGVVYDIGTHLGEKVSNDPSQILVKIANPRKKVIVASVYEKDISAFYVGKEVNITSDNHEEGSIKGSVTYVSDVLDPENKTAQVYIKPSDNAADLKINMFVTITTGADKKGVFRIPKKSLLYKEGKFVVYLKKGGIFSPLNVTLVSDDPQDNFSLVKGIPENSQIALEAITLEKQ